MGFTWLIIVLIESTRNN